MHRPVCRIHLRSTAASSNWAARRSTQQPVRGEDGHGNPGGGEVGKFEGEGRGGNWESRRTGDGQIEKASKTEEEKRLDSGQAVNLHHPCGAVDGSCFLFWKGKRKLQEHTT